MVKHVKEFNAWNDLKKKLHHKENIPFFNEREIWWSCLGINVGHEEDGKNTEFSRPVLIVKKFNHRLFWGVPLTTQIKENKHYHQFSFKGRLQCAMLTQMRLYDAGRLTGKMGRVGEKEYNGIRSDLAVYLK